MAKRKPTQRTQTNQTEGYDSTFERDLHKGVLSSWECHTHKIPYQIEKTYYPDFSKKVGKRIIHVEAKGRFWDGAECAKYIWVKKCLPENEEIVFVFANPDLPMPGARKRKDGTKRTHAEWAEDNGFRYFTEDTFPKRWRK